VKISAKALLEAATTAAKALVRTILPKLAPAINTAPPLPAAVPTTVMLPEKEPKAPLPTAVVLVHNGKIIGKQGDIHARPMTQHRRYRW
jgi:hypothetical protein